MSSNFLDIIGAPKIKTAEEQFLELIAPGGNYTMPSAAPQKRGVQPSAGWSEAVAAQQEAVRTGRQLAPNSRGGSAYYGPGGDPSGSGRGQAQRNKSRVGLMGPDGKPFDPNKGAPAPSTDAPASVSGPTGTGGSTTKTNANGVTQSGRNLSAINMPSLAEFERYAGGTIANFAGPSFPTQADTNKITDGYSKATPVTANQALAVGAAFGGGDSKTAEAIQQGFALGGGDGDAIINTNKPGGPFSGAPQATEGLKDPNADKGRQAHLAYGNESQDIDSALLKGVDAGIAADGGTPPNRAGGTLSKSLADRSGMRFTAPTEQGEGAKYAPPTAASGEEMRRRSAFLDAPDSLSGLRAVERGMGMVYAGGRHYANVNGEIKGIDSADARAIKNAAPGEAQALKDKWVAALSESKTEVPKAASEAQNPTEEGGSATFKAGEPTFDADKTKVTAGTAEKLNDVPHSRDFSVNNTESDKPLFGNAPNITGNKPDNYNLAKKFYLK